MHTSNHIFTSHFVIMPSSQHISPNNMPFTLLQQQTANCYNRLTSLERSYLARYSSFEHIPQHQRSKSLHHYYNLLNRLDAYHAGTHHIASEPTTPSPASHKKTSLLSFHPTAGITPPSQAQSLTQAIVANTTINNTQILPDERTLRRFRRQQIRQKQERLLRNFPDTSPTYSSTSVITPPRTTSPTNSTINTNLSIHRRFNPVTSPRKINTQTTLATHPNTQHTPRQSPPNKDNTVPLTTRFPSPITPPHVRCPGTLVHASLPLSITNKDSVTTTGSSHLDTVLNTNNSFTPSSEYNHVSLYTPPLRNNLATKHSPCANHATWTGYSNLQPPPPPPSIDMTNTT